MVSTGDRVRWTSTEGKDLEGVVTAVGNGSTSKTGDPLCSVTDDEGVSHHARASKFDELTDRLW